MGWLLVLGEATLPLSILLRSSARTVFAVPSSWIVTRGRAGDGHVSPPPTSAKVPAGSQLFTGTLPGVPSLSPNRQPYSLQKLLSATPSPVVIGSQARICFVGEGS